MPSASAVDCVRTNEGARAATERNVSALDNVRTHNRARAAFECNVCGAGTVWDAALVAQSPLGSLWATGRLHVH
jgi:hypothetical protein